MSTTPSKTKQLNMMHHCSLTRFLQGTIGRRYKVYSTSFCRLKENLKTLRFRMSFHIEKCVFRKHSRTAVNSLQEIGMRFMVKHFSRQGYWVVNMERNTKLALCMLETYF
eukprot:NODE_948_length_2940_cov_0.351989.p4 type:complete len:110 gc:universal NODE_948_length_2940_cov_0.351989:1667-1996(+)